MFHLTLGRSGKIHRPSPVREIVHVHAVTRRPSVQARTYHAGILNSVPKFFGKVEKEDKEYKKYEDFKKDLGTRRGSLTKPPHWQIEAATDGNYSDTTREFILKLEKDIAPEKMQRSEHFWKEDLLHALDIIEKSKKIMIFVGKNTASGFVQPDGPAAAALISNALIRINKVPVIISDEKNARMIKCIADKAPISSRDSGVEISDESKNSKEVENGEEAKNSEEAKKSEITGLKIGKYLECHYVEAINGILVSSLSQLIEAHKPDAAMFVGIPGTKAERDACVDDDGKHIDDFNVAFDKALELCHAHEIPTIAICNSKNDVGMGKVILQTENSEKITKDSLAAQAATCTVLAHSLTLGAVALAELTTRMHGKNRIKTAHIEELVDLANAKAKKGITVTPFRQNPRYWYAEMSPVPANPIDTSQLHTKLKKIADSFSKSCLEWPQRLQYIHDYGAPVQHLVLFDSSDGAFIAANDYLGFLRVNSNFEYKITIVTDHAKAPYGQLGEALFSVVVNGIHYAALQTADAIVMVCNSACSKNLDAAVQIAQKILKDLGIEKEIMVINLIETTANMIVKKVGNRPTILCTEITAKNKAYERAIEKAINGMKTHRKINPYVIGCGNTELNKFFNKPLDWASIVNRRDHLSDNAITKAEVIREIDRYVTMIPGDTTLIVLACTHFPALLDTLKARVKEHFSNLGRGDSIPEIVDPIKYQALETINRMRNVEGRNDLNTGIEVHTSEFNKFDEVKKSLIQHTKHMDVEALVGKKRNFRSGEVEIINGDEDGRNALDLGESGFVTPNGIVVKKVIFDPIDIEKNPSKYGVDKHGNPINDNKAATNPS